MSHPNSIMECRPGQETNPLSDLLKQLSTQTVVRYDEPLARRTTLRVGGPADAYIEPASEWELANILKFCKEQELAFFVLGRGSNLLVKDRGFRGLVLSLCQPCFSEIKIQGDRLECGAGAKLKTVAVTAKRNALGGFEFMEGIPGTVGGGLRMNAGAMGGAMFDLVESVRMMDFGGRIHECASREVQVGYRSCPTLKAQIALSAVLRGKTDVQEAIERRMLEFSQKRWKTQPAAPSAGCMFKNPATIPAGKLIDELGLKGTRVGGAYVSTEHGNFIVNDGTATAQNILDLIQLIKRRALDGRGIELQTEVEIIGE